MMVDIQAVTEVIEEAARSLVLPRFARLTSEEIEVKITPDDSGDIVTTVDRDVEAYLSQALTSLAPSAAVLGEEAAHHRPELLDLLKSDRPLWIIDPIDGTKNFAVGDDGFGIMVAYVENGHALAAWVVLPARQQTFAAEAGGGAFLNGKRIHVSLIPPECKARGSLLVRYMPRSLRDSVIESLQGHISISPPSGCSAVDYTDILGGRNDFAVYYFQRSAIHRTVGESDHNCGSRRRSHGSTA